MSNEYGAANRLIHNADVVSKATALASDYFKQGKSVEWVLENVCGNRNARRAVISMAEGSRLLNRQQADALREQHGLMPKAKK